MNINVPSEHALVLLLISKQIDAARRKHPQKYVDAHHALGILREEYLEFEDEVRADEQDMGALGNEALDVACVAARTLLEVVGADRAAIMQEFRVHAGSPGQSMLKRAEARAPRKRGAR